MKDEQSFAAMIGKIRRGDSAAAEELVRSCEPEIRRMVRWRLTDPRLHRLVDSMDICQSVMANFFLRAAAGQFDLTSPEQVLKLLTTMARNRLNDEARKYRGPKRDNRREVAGGDEIMPLLAAADDSPSAVVAGRELLAELRTRLSDNERQVVELRAEGHEWAEIAERLDIGAEAVRKRHSRAIDRISRELGLDEAV